MRPVAIGRQLRNPASGSSFAPEAAVLPRSVFLERPAKPCVDLLSHIVNPRNRGKLRFSAERKIEFSKRGKNSDFRDPGKSEIPNLALVCSLAFSGVFRSAIFRENEKKRVFLEKMTYFLRTSKSISGFRVARPRASHASPDYACVRPCTKCPNAPMRPSGPTCRKCKSGIFRICICPEMLFSCICNKTHIRAQHSCIVGAN